MYQYLFGLKGMGDLARDRTYILSHICGFCFLNREAMAKVDEGAAAPLSGSAARLRFFSMKRTVSQQSFDGISLDNSGPEDRISVDSDGSDSFVMLSESGRWKQSQEKLKSR